MATRAKFVCNSVEDFGTSKRVKLSAVYQFPGDGPPTEDDRFTKATPWGEITMTVDNPEASCQFIPGGRYYVDFQQVLEG
jgi:hypothetical protein